MSSGSEPTITLTEDNGWWIIRHPETGIVSQGGTRVKAIANLDEALAIHHSDVEEPTDEELRETEADPEKDVPGESMSDPFE
jgi:predicted RNase H-like HicB family nuclease